MGYVSRLRIPNSPIRWIFSGSEWRKRIAQPQGDEMPRCKDPTTTTTTTKLISRHISWFVPMSRVPVTTRIISFFSRGAGEPNLNLHLPLLLGGLYNASYEGIRRVENPTSKDAFHHIHSHKLCFTIYFSYTWQVCL